MPTNLKRVTGRGDLHFITFCCYQRRPLLEPPQARDFAVQILAEVRAKYDFALVGYVIMPEHVHFLIEEKPTLVPGAVVQVFKQRVSRSMRGEQAEALQHFPGHTPQRQRRTSPLLAAALLRLQCLHEGEAKREVRVYAREPGRGETRDASAGLAVE